VASAVVEHQPVERIRTGRSKAVQAYLERAAVEVRECQKEGRPGAGVDSAREIAMVDLGRHRGAGLAPAGRDAPSDDGASTQAGCVLGKDLDGASTAALGQLLGADGGQGGLKLRHRFRTFVPCDGRGRLTLACSVYWTRAWTLAYDKVTCSCSASQVRIWLSPATPCGSWSVAGSAVKAASVMRRCTGGAETR
jgi:hypothetical protein